MVTGGRSVVPLSAGHAGLGVWESTPPCPGPGHTALPQALPMGRRVVSTVSLSRCCGREQLCSAGGVQWGRGLSGAAAPAREPAAQAGPTERCGGAHEGLGQPRAPAPLPPSIHHLLLGHPSPRGPSGPTLGTRKEDTGPGPPPMEEAVPRLGLRAAGARVSCSGGGRAWPREVREQRSGPEVPRSPARLGSCTPQGVPGRAQRGQEGAPRGQKPGRSLLSAKGTPKWQTRRCRGDPAAGGPHRSPRQTAQAPGSCTVGNPSGSHRVWAPAAPHFSPRFPTFPSPTSCPPFSA